MLELVVFKLNEGTTREQFLARESDPLVARGGVAQLVRNETRLLLHPVRGTLVSRWETLEHAQAAAEAAMSSDSCAPMFALIDMDSALMLYGGSSTTPAARRRSA